jgi:hypothetical protein
MDNKDSTSNIIGFRHKSAKTLGDVSKQAYAAQNLMAKRLTNMNPEDDTIIFAKKEVEALSLTFCDAIDYMGRLDRALDEMRKHAKDIGGLLGE